MVDRAGAQKGHQRSHNNPPHALAATDRVRRAGQRGSGEQHERDETQCAAFEPAHQILVFDSPDQVLVVREVPALDAPREVPIDEDLVALWIEQPNMTDLDRTIGEESNRDNSTGRFEPSKYRVLV